MVGKPQYLLFLFMEGVEGNLQWFPMAFFVFRLCFLVLGFFGSSFCVAFERWFYLFVI